MKRLGLFVVTGEAGFDHKAEFLTLRDYIAIEALSGYLAGCTPKSGEAESFARAAYALADEMLKARAEK